MDIDSNKKLKQYLVRAFNSFRQDNPTSIIDTPSKYFGQIGSTTIEDIVYQTQLDIQLQALKAIFNNVIPDDLIHSYELIGSPDLYEYRLKMEFVTTHNPFYEPNNRMGQRKAGKFNFVIDMDECNLIKSDWFQKVRDIYLFLLDNNVILYDLVSHKGNLRYLVIKEYNDQAMLLIVATDFKHSSYKQAAKEALNVGFKSVYLIQNDSLGDTAEGKIAGQFGDKTIKLPLGDKQFHVAPFTFFQNNITAFNQIIGFVKEYIQSNELVDTSILYDLYSGVGSLGIIFADYFEKVIGFDIVEDSIKLANDNALLNGAKNAQYYVKDLNKLDFTELNNHIVLHNQTVIVDPPRAGLEKKGVKHIQLLKPRTIIYISCNPVTQRADLEELQGLGYVAKQVRGFDLFPHTYHMENVVILEK